MSWDPSQKLAVDSSIVDTNCVICLGKIVSEDKAPCEGEKPRVLDCSHIFHRECIGSWLVQKHSCPLCRTRLRVDTPEARPLEMSFQEILAVPDHRQRTFIEQENVRGLLFVILQSNLERRRVRGFNFNQNPPLVESTRKARSFAPRFFHRFQ